MSEFELVLLGTGIPAADPKRAGPSQVLDIGGELLLVDCGNGVARRLVEAGYRSAKVNWLFITHLHSDHTIDLGHFIITRWIEVPEGPLTIIGPKGMREYVDNTMRLLAWDIDNRQFKNRLSEERRRIDVVEIDDGWTHDAGGWQVRAIRVQHAPVEHAFGFRFDASGASVVISGDTTPCDALTAASAGVDILVHEVWLRQGSQPAQTHMTKTQAKVLADRLNSYHTLPDQVGKIAAKANPRLLVLSHLGPADPGEMAAEVALDFERFVVGEDLMRFDVRSSED